MPRLSLKSRRNFGYHHRRAETAGCVFLPKLTPEQSRAAVQAIGPRVRNFAMGLTDHEGGWIGYLAG